MPLGTQIVWLFVLAIPVACLTWSVTNEEVFREIREFCEHRSQRCTQTYQRKFFYLFTCEYCFSHYVSLLAVWVAGYRLLHDGWRGFVIAWLAVVWIANLYMSIHARLKVSIKSERVEVQLKQEELGEEL